MVEPDLLAVRNIQRTTIGGVVLLAGIAAVVSFRHMHELCLRHGEDHFAAVLIPLAVDGAIVVASMSILLTNRYGSRGGALAWGLLVVASLASLGANIAVAEPGMIGHIIAAWPSAALIGSYELLMSQVRRLSVTSSRVQDREETLAAGGLDVPEAGAAIPRSWGVDEGNRNAPWRQPRCSPRSPTTPDAQYGLARHSILPHLI
ncbi:DUF2637 domain-containing protein [Nonomuraea sp. NPDC026600]|uniref:DUF2637 domain-containing protein n=1 Tax=Nonomuraea sp. NPDC026600 TaxID=3155363 RepID=UPI0033CFAC4A